MTTTDLRAVLAEMEEASGNEFSAQRDLPRLTAAVRAVLDVASFVDQAAEGRGASVAAAYRDIADRLRNALAAALAPPDDGSES